MGRPSWLRRPRADTDELPTTVGGAAGVRGSAVAGEAQE
jgi:hypothetical protein